MTTKREELAEVPAKRPGSRPTTDSRNSSDTETLTPSKRRKSSRVHTPINYSQTSKRSKHRSSTELDLRDHQGPQSIHEPHHQSQDQSQQIVRKNGIVYIEDTKAIQKHHEQNQSPSDIDKLGRLSAEHHLLTSELFHLQQFTSLAIWDPESTQSKYQQDYTEEKYGLWRELDQQNGNGTANGRQRKSRHSARVTVNPLKPRVEDAQTKFIDEVVNPSKFYHDHFLIEKSTIDTKRNHLKSMIIQPTELKPVKREKSTLKRRRLQMEDSDDESQQEDNNDGKEEEEKEQQEEEEEAKQQQNDDGDDEGNEEEEQQEEAEEEQEDLLSDSDSEDEEPLFAGSLPTFRIHKLKLKLQPPPQTITQPAHVAKPEFPSLEAYLGSYKSLDEDVTQEEFDQYIEENRDLVGKLKRANQNNVLQVDDEFNITKVPPPQPWRDPLKTTYTHQDHLVAQAIHLSRLIGDSKKARISRARKVSQMVESHFKRLIGAEERKRKEEERRLKALARNAITAVKKRWTLAEKAYRILKKQETEELKRIKGKEHLSQMLEHSTQLLEAQLTKKSDDEDDEDEDDEDENEDEDDDSDSDTELLHNGLDGEALQTIDDSKLSVDQLKLKYAHLQSLNFEEVSEATGTERETTAVDDESGSEEEDDKERVVLTEKEKEVVESELNQDHDTLLDSDTSMESDSDEGSSEEDSSDESESGERNGGGLASLFGNFNKEEDEDVGYSDEEKETSAGEEDEAEEVNQANNKDTPNSTPETGPGPEQDEQIEDTKNSRATSEVTDTGVVDVPNPSLLLRGDLRYYQKQGLNWLASLYNNHTNGILADEMGLGKTIQTISLLSYLAVFKGIWGPHLIIVPTSVLLNWEMEFKRFAPGFKLMVYYGSPQQRKEKRKGWNKPDTFHVCITSYQLVCQDQQIFKRKRWRYMILDEAHNIKNFKSNRWNALLNFNTENRLLLTGTPLQNNIMELWSLLYFLMPSSKANQSMPSGFANLDDFQQWFGKPVDKIIEGGNHAVDEESKKTVAKLHQVLRPYLLRRLKADVESQMPGKYEHVVYCRLSKRQYKLYHEYLARSDTKEMLKNANYISIINCLMQLRKVCNHPDLFEERPILTSFAVSQSVITPYQVTKDVVLRRSNDQNRDRLIDFNALNLNFVNFEMEGLNTNHCDSIGKIKSSSVLIEQVENLKGEVFDMTPNFSDLKQFYEYTAHNQKQELLGQLQQTLYLNNLRCDKRPMYGGNLIKTLKFFEPISLEASFGDELMKPLESRILSMTPQVDRFAFVTPPVVTLNMKEMYVSKELASELSSDQSLIENPFHKMQTKLSIQFPDKSLLLYDCGKLQKLSKLLQDLKDGGHRALIFTQMTKVLDILEQFLNIMGIRYMRLDGSTKIEDRQILTEKFNSDPKIMVFILSTRSGGLGINLTGADTVIFYDSDWNPAMDKQCQDRCHRIGQTRDVHIYRFVSEYTIESNILKKANQKRHLDNVIIQEGEFTTDYFSKLSVNDLLGDEAGDGLDGSKLLFDDSTKITNALAQAEDETDAKAAKEAMKEVETELDQEDFDENGTDGEKNKKNADEDEEFGQDDEGVGHIDEYMIRYIANGFYYD